MPMSEPTLFDMLATAILAVGFETLASTPRDRFPIRPGAEELTFPSRVATIL
jgi:hypothetical protein